jgi:autotransporter-associated beta strand protein
MSVIMSMNFRSAFALIALIGFSLTARSQTSTWNGNTPNWADASNWSGGLPSPTTGTIFNELFLGTNYGVNIGLSATAQSITFSEVGANAFTFSSTEVAGGTLTLGGSGGASFIQIDSTVNDVQTFAASATIIYSGASSFALRNNGTGTSRIQMNSNMTNGAVALTVDGSQPVTINGIIGGGSGGINKSNTGTLTLNGANTFTGAVSITNGTVILGNASALGTVAGGTTVSGTGVLNLGGQTIGSEAVSISGTGFGGNGVLINSTGTGTLNGTITMTAASTIGAGNITLGGAVNGAFALTKIGTGTLTLTGSSGFNGGLNIENGVVALTTANNRINASNVVTLGSGTNSGQLVLGSGLSDISQTIAGLATSGTGSNSVVGGASAVSTLVINTTGTSTFNGTLGGGGTNENNLALTKQGTGTLVLGGTNTLTGAIAVENGSLRLTNNAALPTTANVTLGSGANSGLLVLGSGASAVSVTLPNVNQSGSGTGNAVVGGATVNSTLTLPVSTGTVTLGTTLGGSGTDQNNLDLVKTGNGTLIINTANTYAGTTTVSAGTLTISNTSGSATGTGTTTVASTATLSGTGTAGSTILNGTIAPGNNIGTINFASGSTQTWAPNGTYNFQYGQNLVNNSGEGTTHDFINSLGDLNVTATTTAGQQFNLNLIYTGPDQPVPPQVTIRIAQFTGNIVNFDAAKFNVIGEFSAASVPVVALDGNYVTLTFTPVPEPATLLGLAGLGAWGWARVRRRQSRQLNG